MQPTAGVDEQADGNIEGINQITDKMTEADSLGIRTIHVLVKNITGNEKERGRMDQKSHRKDKPQRDHFKISIT